MMRHAAFLGLFFSLTLIARAQSFSSGSTGADGPLDCSNNCLIQLPESGILNYTTVNVPSNTLLRFKPNYRNTPVILLAQGDVTIGGQIDVAASGRVPGPGGFYGGLINGPGYGPGAGSGQQPGKWLGSLSLVPIVGGSGSGGCCGLPGGGGGGALVIASSTSIILLPNSVMNANGSASYDGHEYTGSGGAIRLVANSINIAGSLNADGTYDGVIRLEAPAGSLFFTGSADPLPILSTTVNPHIISDSSTPSLSITSIGGFPVSYTAGRPDMVDLILPNQVSDPISVLVQAHNIPVGTQVNLTISGPSSGTFTPATLSGTQASSSATIGVSGLSRTGATYLIAFADFTLAAGMANSNRKGPDQIAKVRVIAKPGSESRLVFLRKTGTEIDLTRVPKVIQRQFGLN